MEKLKPYAPAPIPLTDLILAAKGEGSLLQILARSDLREEHRTARPWSIRNQHNYLEAPREVDGCTPLHVATELNYDRLVMKIVADGARVDLPDHHGRTALMLAAARGHTKTVEALLGVGAAHGAKDDSGKQPLHHAMTGSPGAAAIVGLLVRARGDVDARDRRGVTPLMLGAAGQAASAVDAVLEAGAARLGFDAAARTPLDHAFAGAASRRRPPQPGAAPPEAPRAARAHGRWDGLGGAGAQRSLLFAERTSRRRALPLLGVDARDRLHAATPQLA